VLRQQLGRLGGTGFVLERLAATIDGQPMVPLSILGGLRREMVARLQALRDSAARRSWPVAPQPVLPQLRVELEPPAAGPPGPQLSVLCRSLRQLQAVLELDVPRIYADFQDIREYRKAVALARGRDAEIFLATPRIQKPGELGIFHALARHGADGFLVRNLAGLEFFARRGSRCVADFSLNAANELTVDCLLRLGAERVTASYDLNRDQLSALVRHAPATGWRWSFTSTCRCSTWSTACSARCSRRARTRRTAAAPATGMKCGCETTSGRSIR
jgi:putative protease